MSGSGSAIEAPGNPGAQLGTVRILRILMSDGPHRHTLMRRHTFEYGYGSDL